ncbi:MAG: hypothetical protein KAT35_00640, partial [Candidatus Aenigmarchaeota archaeon]|nr:hypothetical protein [Candidatus Aenigmarchaeota archaeon]
SGNIFSSHISRCREIVGDNMWFLIPGIGTQGGFVEETVKAAYTGPGSITINSSSGIIFASSDEDFAEAAANKARELRDQIRSAGGDVKSSSDNPDKGVNIDILEMGKEELLALNPDTVKGRLSKEEVLHIFKTLGGFWAYDHDAGKSGRPGYHALLKSGRHSDGFINSKVVLCHDNIRKIFARQITLKIGELGLQKPEFIAGIPEGATALGEDVAGMLGSDVARMEKVVEGDNKVIKMRTRLDPGQKLILVEDFCTKGTGFKEAVRDIASITKDASLIMPYELVILNRGGLKEIVVDGMGTYTITPLVEHRISDWDPVDEGCPLCKLGSKAIKPKDPLDNWELLMKSQDT